MKIDRDRLVKECQVRNLKVKRTGRTVKQQVVVLTEALKTKGEVK